MNVKIVCYLLLCSMAFAWFGTVFASSPETEKAFAEQTVMPTALPASSPTAPPTVSPAASPTASPAPTPYEAPYTVPEGYTLTYLLTVNKALNRVIAFSRSESGAYTHVEKVFVCSVGSEYCDNTAPGTFYTSDRYAWHRLFGGTFGQYATRFNGSILFHSVPYKAMAKDTLKTKEYNKLGTAASMGCVRLSVADAKWIFDFCQTGTCVIVYSAPNENWEAPLPQKIDLNDPRSGWDPTDPDPVNPWNL